MSLTSFIKSINLQNSGKMLGSASYFKKSPSGILLKKASQKALNIYATNKKILDAGAGRLAYKDLILNYSSDYTSSDFAKTHSDLDVVCDIEKMTFKKNSFELVFCSQVLEHVPHPQLALAEIHRVLKPKGIAIITVPMLGYIHNAPYDFYRYTQYGLQTLSKEAGFKIKELKAIGGFFSFLGYVRSTAIMPLFTIPVLGKLIFYLNFLFSNLDIYLDRLTKNEKIFPLNYLLILEKRKS